MKIFTDLHHGDLYFSLHLLFEKRLGHKLYRPIGLEWFNAGYWLIAAPYGNRQDTINQFLDINQRGYDAYNNLNGNHYIEDDIYYIHEPGHNYYQKAITLKQFKNMEFDIIMPTYPGHDKPFENLRDRFQSKAKMIMQMGNIKQRTHITNVLHSCAYDRPQAHQHCLRYHQEIDPNHFYYIKPNEKTRNIYSVVNCAPYLQEYNKFKSHITDANWKYYGAGSPDGALAGAKKVGEKMREANVAWHLKPHGGVGHSTKGWFATGRPIVTNMSQHRKAGGDAMKLFVPGVTCVDLDSGSVHENEQKIKTLLEPDINQEWSERVYDRFKQVINYDADEERVKKFLENLR